MLKNFWCSDCKENLETVGDRATVTQPISGKTRKYDFRAMSEPLLSIGCPQQSIHCCYYHYHYFKFQVLENITRILLNILAQTMKNLHAIQETLVHSLGQEDPLEKEMPTHSSFLFFPPPYSLSVSLSLSLFFFFSPVFLPGKCHEQRSLARYNPWGCRVRHDWVT